MNDKREFLITAFRLACSRAKCCDLALQKIGCALAGGLIDPDEALEWARVEGVSDFLGDMPSGEHASAVGTHGGAA